MEVTNFLILEGHPHGFFAKRVLLRRRRRDADGRGDGGHGIEGEGEIRTTAGLSQSAKGTSTFCN